ncbi:MAG: glycosyltransferase [Candidatus Moraniibacteriota bacterium]
MKILEVNKFNYVRGGADRHFLDVTRLLKSSGHEVATFSMENSRNLFSPWQKYFVSYVGYNKNDSTLTQKIKGTFRMFYSFEAKTKMRKMLLDFEPDLVHIHNIYHQISYSIIALIKKRGIPIVMTVHDYELISPDREEYLEAVGTKYWKFIVISKKYSLIKRTILVLRSYFEEFIGWKDNVAFFIAPSQFVAERLISGGIKKEKIVVMSHFISKDATDYSQEKSELGDSYAFYFGRISKEKGALEMIETFRKIEKIKLILAGEVEDDLQITSDKNISYLGYLGRDQLGRYIKNAQFSVSFSRLPETFGLIALESISFGKPFLGFDSGAFGEIIDRGVTGFICKDTVEMEEIIKKMVDGEIRFQKDMVMKVAYEKFGQEKYLKKLIGLFNSLKHQKYEK